MAISERSKRRVARAALARFAPTRWRRRVGSRTEMQVAYLTIRLAMAYPFGPRREIVADRLADALSALDEAAFATDCDGFPQFRRFSLALQRMYHEVDSMLREVAD